MNECTQCEALTINGVYCHEQGCPEAWQGVPRDCWECGFDFVAEERYERLCEGCAQC